MFSAYPAAIQLDLAILFTALAWALGFFVATRKFHLFSSLAIGCFVVLIGYTLGALHAPAHGVEAERQIDNLRLAGGVRDRGVAMGQDGGQQSVLGGADRDERK